jgi:hypothetical protein
MDKLVTPDRVWIMVGFIGLGSVRLALLRAAGEKRR